MVFRSPYCNYILNTLLKTLINLLQYVVTNCCDHSTVLFNLLKKKSDKNCLINVNEITSITKTVVTKYSCFML